MSTLHTAYAILQSLETHKKTDYMGKIISPAALKVSEEEWRDVILDLLDKRYIAGVTTKENIIGETEFDISEIRITVDGAQYLHENSVMSKLAKVATNTISIGISKSI